MMKKTKDKNFRAYAHGTARASGLISSMPSAAIAVSPAAVRIAAMWPIQVVRITATASATPGIARSATMMRWDATVPWPELWKYCGKTYANPKTEKSFVKWARHMKHVVMKNFGERMTARAPGSFVSAFAASTLGGFKGYRFGGAEGQWFIESIWLKTCSASSVRPRAMRKCGDSRKAMSASAKK